MTADILPTSSTSAMTTGVIFGVISVFLYFFLLKPLFSSGAQPSATGAPRRPVVVGAPDSTQGRPPASPANGGRGSSSWTQNTRMPPHASKADALLVDGMVSFRHSTAVSYEVGFDAEAIATNRKERARVLSRILALDVSSSSTPPARGTTAVVSIPVEDVDCAKLRRILYLLGTYFNLVVVLSVGDAASPGDIDAYIAKLRGPDPKALPREILPDHRIVAAQSRMGRIALVRQLGRVEVVLDHETAMKDELDRFGFKVLLYGDDRTTGASRLASRLMLDC